MRWPSHKHLTFFAIIEGEEEAAAGGGGDVCMNKDYLRGGGGVERERAILFDFFHFLYM